MQTNNDSLPDSFKKDTSLTMLKRLENYLNKSILDVFNAVGDAQTQKNLLKEYSDSFNIDFETKYTQKKIQLDFDINGDIVNIYVHDQDSEDNGKIGNGYKLSQRSQGLKWYLNFYITINGENIKNVEKNIENIFNKEFFLKEIMGYTQEEISAAAEINSQELKQNKKKDGKYLLAKHFCAISGNYNMKEILNKDGETLINLITSKIKKDD